MDRKKVIVTSLASAAILGAGFVTSQPAVVRADEAPVASQSKAEAEKNYDAAKKQVEDANKAVEEAQKALDEATAAQKRYEDGQKQTEEKGAREKAASKELNEAAKTLQLAYRDYGQAKDQAARKLADEKIEEAKKQEKKAKAKFDEVRAMVIPEPDALAATKKKAEEAPKLTKKLEAAKRQAEEAKQKAEKARIRLDKLTKEQNTPKSEKEKLLKEIEEIKEEIKSGEENGTEAYYLEGLKARLADLEKALETLMNNLPPVHEVPEFGAHNPEIKKILKEIEEIKEQIKSGEENGTEAYYLEGLKARLADLEKALETLMNNLPPVHEVPEFGAHNPEIKKILKEIEEIKEQIKSGEENGAEDYYLEGLKARLADLEKALETLMNNLPPVHEVPDHNDSSNPGANPPGVNPPGVNPPGVNPPGVNPPGVNPPRVDPPVFAGTDRDKTYQAPGAKTGKQELPSTGAKDNVALASLGFLGLFLGALPFVKRKN
ncbi:LPXTG cell wall anchor domain-containing protein [Streptococcus sp. Marseille-Q5986]|uniref:LPXTG cell wall anchor domain-containing protein n=1 Tax=Streptococcus sp. Marseille-Q5986 TaxID=2972782 RepID=UPI0022647B3E|nr:LPXTG cell wall anchor domain-containing protein [Streptococcus sp. Marseille-Q5986]